MKKAVAKQVPPATDPAIYREEFPQFWECRRGHDWQYHVPTGLSRHKPDFVPVLGDPLCNFERISTCVDGCTKERRERRLAYRLPNGDVHRAKLPTTYSMVEGFAVVGTRITPSDVDYASIEDALAVQEAAEERRRKAKESRSARRTTKPPERGHLRRVS